MTQDQIWQEYQRRKSGEADKIGKSSLFADRPGSLKDTADGWLALMLRTKDNSREQTAATIFAMLFQVQLTPQFSEHSEKAAFAVRLADMLRAELAKGAP